MIIRFDLHEPHDKTYVFANVVKLVVVGNTTTIGYYDEANEYHEETAETPRDITFINIGGDAEKDRIVLTMASKPERYYDEPKTEDPEVEK